MLVDTEDLEQLAETCLATAKTIKSYLASNGLPQMTFDQNGPTVFPPANAEIQFARMTLQEAAQRLVDLSAGPEEVITTGPYYKLHDVNAFRYVWRYGLAKAVPLDSSISYSDLASNQGLDASQLKQFLRQLMQIHVFHEVDGQVAHTAASKLLLNPLPGSMNALVSEDILRMIAKQVDTLEKWGHGSQELTETAFNYTFNTDKYMYGYFEENQGIRERFSNTMTWVSGLDTMSYRHILTGFDWASLGDATVVDIAGSMGACSVKIAEANPNLKMIVQDLPKVVKRAQDQASSVVPEGMRDRFTFMVQNFFEPQTIKNADVYFQRMNYQNYSDKYAIKILQSLVPAMGPTSRLVVTDQLLPPVGAAPGPVERFMRTQDLHMLLLLNAKQRDYEQWNHLFKTADPRLSIKNVVTPPGSIMSFIEVVLNPSEGTTVPGNEEANGMS